MPVEEPDELLSPEPNRSVVPVGQGMFTDQSALRDKEARPGYTESAYRQYSRFCPIRCYVLPKEIYVLRILACLEIVAAIIFLALAVWPFSEYCSGRFLGLDCESRAIFGVNMFGPLGILGLICSAWSLNSKSAMPQYILLFGLLAIMGYWLAHML